MLKKTYTYTDYNGVKRTEDFFFDLSQAEIEELAASVDGGLKGMVEKIIQTQDQKGIIETLKKVIIAAYGEKSPDGRFFIKNEETKSHLLYSPVYSMLFMELGTDDEKAAEFINGITPTLVTTKQRDEVIVGDNVIPLNAN